VPVHAALVIRLWSDADQRIFAEIRSLDDLESTDPTHTQRVSGRDAVHEVLDRAINGLLR
jgi:hypothetical protein